LVATIKLWVQIVMKLAREDVLGGREEVNVGVRPGHDATFSSIGRSTESRGTDHTSADGADTQGAALPSP
jgi:hypothetical protein